MPNTQNTTFYITFDDYLSSLIEKTPMEINENIILRLEKLAKLSLQKEERQQLKASLEKMLEMIVVLSDVNTENTQPLIHINEEVRYFRDDVVNQNIKKEDALKNAPQRIDDYFAVPKVVNK